MRLTPLFLAAASCLAADPALTIYNGGFAVVRETLPVELKAGVNQLEFAGATARVHPDSVILRDVAGKAEFRILEQSYRNDPVTEAKLLSLFEGKAIEFNRREPNKPDRVVTGKVIRGGFVPGEEPVQPIIEVDGKLQFSLPGEPVFPSLGRDNILRPTLGWKLAAAAAGKFDAEVAYLSEGFSWEASYNLVGSEKSDMLDMVGWVTMANRSGTSFNEARIKLMAGEVQRAPRREDRGVMMAAMRSTAGVGGAAEPAVTGKTFDEFHLYSLANPTTLRDMETKQVEFVRASGVKAERVYVLEDRGMRRADGKEKVQVYREFRNDEANRLGMALPTGMVRFYTQDEGRQLEFVGEGEIGHTPKGELIRVLVGTSFDLVGERRVTEQTQDGANRTATRTVEVKVRNRKAEAATVKVRERAQGGASWAITAESQPHERKDAATFEFTVTLQPGEEKVVTYTIRHNW